MADLPMTAVFLSLSTSASKTKKNLNLAPKNKNHCTLHPHSNKCILFNSYKLSIKCNEASNMIHIRQPVVQNTYISRASNFCDFHELRRIAILNTCKFLELPGIAQEFIRIEYQHLRDIMCNILGNM